MEKVITELVNTFKKPIDWLMEYYSKDYNEKELSDYVSNLTNVYYRGNLSAAITDHDESLCVVNGTIHELKIKNVELIPDRVKIISKNDKSIVVEHFTEKFDYFQIMKQMTENEKLQPTSVFINKKIEKTKNQYVENVEKLNKLYQRINAYNKQLVLIQPAIKCLKCGDVLFFTSKNEVCICGQCNSETLSIIMKYKRYKKFENLFENFKQISFYKINDKLIRNSSQEVNRISKETGDLVQKIKSHARKYTI